MPGRVRTHSSMDDDDRSSVAPSENDQVTPRPRDPNKRPRLSDENGDAVDDSWMLSPPGTTQPNRTRTPAVQTNGAGLRNARASTVLSEGPTNAPDEFRPGQLLEVHVRNFVTYTDATFQPGPSLNMIIGPNGTGKSSVVCAICIGLGFPTGLLGRAKELSEFVKHGARDATIEITLKGHPGKVNQLVRLDFSREGDKKQWYLNGQQCRAKDVHRVVSGFGIQIDNLCHFLPQDRVVEFSRLSAKDRLVQTLRAAAPVEVLEQHEELKTLSADRKKLGTEQMQKRTQLTQWKTRQDNQRQDVERMRERQEVLQNLKHMKRLKPIARHMEHRRAHDELKEKKKQMVDDLNRLNEQVEPFDRAKKKKEVYRDKVQKALDMRQKLATQFETQVKKCQDEQKKAESDMKEVDAARKTEIDLYKRRGAQVQRVKSDIVNVEAQMEQQPLEIDAAEYNRRIAAKVREVRELEQQRIDTREGGRERQQQIDQKKSEIRQCNTDIENLKSQSGQQKHKLGILSQDTARAWDYIEKNRDKFKSEVYGPALITCNVTDSKYAAMIESVMQKNDYLRITCTSYEDYEYLSKYLAQQMGLSDYSLINLRSKREEFPPPLREDQAQQVGLDGWASDFLEGPEPVITMLCAEKQLHGTGVVWRDVDDRQFQALQASGLSSWITSKSSYRVTTRREYGPGATSTRVSNIAPRAQYWSSQGVDVSVEMDLKQRVAELTDNLQSLESTQGGTRSRLEEIQRSIKQLEDEKTEIQNEKEEKQRHNNTLAALPHKLQGLKNKLEEFQALESEYRQRLQDFNKQREQLTLRNGQLAINYANLVDVLRQKHAEVMPAAIAVIEAESDAEQLAQQHTHATQERDRLDKEVKEVSKEIKRLRDEAIKAFNEYKKLSEQDDELRQYFEALSEEEKTRTPQELDAEIEAMQARLETLYEGDPNLLREFEDRGRRIEKLEGDLQHSAGKIQELQQTITEIRNTWEPEVDALVEKISEAFSNLFARINCAGSVEVYKPGAGGSLRDEEEAPARNDDLDETALEDGHDYENWAIQILVKFRENEQLSVLDAHRQSGGERAVTTIYYLMALQKLSRAPFRVVDEINQGMDPRNERIVHERMVDMSCGTDEEEEDGFKSQYFLITPKLLPGLKYERGMKVHCICSGEFMPEVKRKEKPAIELAGLLAKKREMNAQACRASAVGVGA